VLRFCGRSLSLAVDSTLVGPAPAMTVSWFPGPTAAFQLLPCRVDVATFDIFERSLRLVLSQRIERGRLGEGSRRLNVFVSPKMADVSIAVELPQLTVVSGAELLPAVAPYVAGELAAGPLCIKFRQWKRRACLHVGQRFKIIDYAGLTLIFNGDGKIGLGAVVEV
jgi:hypothetical protein